MTAPPRRRGGALRAIRTLVLAGLAVVVALVAFAAIRSQSHPVAALARTAPERTALMKQREREAKAKGHPLRIDQRWVDYGSVSPALRRAILIAEDDKFFSHDGLDWDEIQAAARKNLEERKIVRGGSTVSQQLAKNLFLGDARTLTRKVEEALLAIRLERTLPKRRIFELYLNLIEWGDGIFGAEAAARRYFGVSAAHLNERQAVLLAAVIINPRRFSVLHPNRRIESRVRLIASRMRRRGFLTAEQYAAAIGRPIEPPRRGLFDWFFGGGGASQASKAKAPVPEPEPAPEGDLGPEDPLETPADTAAPDTAATDPGAGARNEWGVTRTPLARLPSELRAGEVVEIRWEMPPGDVEEMELLLSIDDGRHFTLRISPELDPGSRRFRWRVPNLGAESARIAMRVGREKKHDGDARPVQRDREREMPSTSTAAGARGVTRAHAAEGPRHASSRHDEQTLAPSAAFCIVANPAQPPARFALREGWMWVGDESELAAVLPSAMRRSGPELVAARDEQTAEPPPRLPIVAARVSHGVQIRARRSAGARVNTSRHSLPIRFAPLRN